MKKPRPTNAIGRKRRTLGWTLFTLGLLVAGVWMWSGWWEVVFAKGAHRIRIAGGLVEWNDFYGYAPDYSLAPHRFATVQGVQAEWRFWTFWSPRGMLYSDVYARGLGAFTLARWETQHAMTAITWPIPLLLWAPAALLLRSGIVARRRALGNRCKTCGYDLAGLASDAPCPECGKGAVTT